MIHIGPRSTDEGLWLTVALKTTHRFDKQELKLSKLYF